MRLGIKAVGGSFVILLSFLLISTIAFPETFAPFVKADHTPGHTEILSSTAEIVTDAQGKNTLNIHKPTRFYNDTTMEWEEGVNPVSKLNLTFNDTSGYLNFTYSDKHWLAGRLLFVSNYDEAKCDQLGLSWDSQYSRCYSYWDDAKATIDAKNLTYDVPHSVNDTSIKFAFELGNIKKGIATNLTHLGIRFEEKSSTFNWGDLELDGNAITFKDRLHIDFQDIEDTGHTVNWFIENKTVIFGQILNQTAVNESDTNDTFDIFLDPSLTIDGTTTEVCGSDDYDTVTIENSGTAEICDYNGTAGTGYWNVTADSFTVDSTSTVTATGAGFEGGNDGCAITGEQGDSPTGTGGTSASNNGGGGGGGKEGDPLSLSGGGGGGHGGTAGGGGSSLSIGGGGAGTSYGSSSTFNTEFGSGGGTGGCHPGNGDRGDANAGGGIILINSSSIDISGSLLSLGGIGNNGATSPNEYRGGNGGGSGGTIMLLGGNINISSSNIVVDGSNGFNGNSPPGDSGGGGGGSGGRIKIFYQSSFTNTTSVVTSSGGTGGTGNNGGDTGGTGSDGTIYYEQNDTLGFNAAPSVFLESPANNTDAGAEMPTFEFRANDTDGDSLSEAILFVNGVAAGINSTSFTNDTTHSITSNVSVPIDTLSNWTVQVSDDQGNSDNATVQYFWYNFSQSYSNPIYSNPPIVVGNSEHSTIQSNYTGTGTANYTSLPEGYTNLTVINSSSDSISFNNGTTWVSFTAEQAQSNYTIGYNSIPFTKVDSDDLTCPAGYTKTQASGENYCRKSTDGSDRTNYFYIFQINGTDGNTSNYQIDLDINDNIFTNFGGRVVDTRAINDSAVNVSESTSNDNLTISVGTAYASGSLGSGIWEYDYEYHKIIGGQQASGGGGSGGSTTPKCGNGIQDPSETRESCPKDFADLEFTVIPETTNSVFIKGKTNKQEIIIRNPNPEELKIKVGWTSQTEFVEDWISYGVVTETGGVVAASELNEDGFVIVSGGSEASPGTKTVEFSIDIPEDAIEPGIQYEIRFEFDGTESDASIIPAFHNIQNSNTLTPLSGLFGGVQDFAFKSFKFGKLTIMGWMIQSLIVIILIGLIATIFAFGGSKVSKKFKRRAKKLNRRINNNFR